MKPIAESMITITFDLDTDVPPGRFIAALTDFSDKRAAVFRNIDTRYFRVHSVSDTWAEVTEGSTFAGAIWEHVRYDWSQPNTVRIDTLEGNTFGPGSYWLYQITPIPTGAHIHFELHRVPVSLKGRLLGVLISLFGARTFQRDLESTLHRLR